MADSSVLRERIKRIAEEESSLEVELKDALNRRATLMSKTSSFVDEADAYISSLHLSGVETERQLSETAKSQSSLFSTLLELKKRKENLTNTLSLVRRISALESCSQGVEEAMKREDFISAAKYMQTFLEAEGNAGRGETGLLEGDLDKLRVLKGAEGRLKSTLQRRFEDAASAGDRVAATTFVKLFPLVGLRDEGMDVFVRHSVRLMQDQLKKAFLDQRGKDVAFTSKLDAVFKIGVLAIKRFESNAREIFGEEGAAALLVACEKEISSHEKSVVNAFKEYAKKAAVVNKDKQRGTDEAVRECADMLRQSKEFRKAMCTKIEELLSAQKGSVSAKRLEELRRIKQRPSMNTESELIGPYVEMESDWMQKCIDKAVASDELLLEERVVSSLDDAYFIIDEVCMRSIDTGCCGAACSVMNTAAHKLRGYNEAVARRWEKNLSTTQSSVMKSMKATMKSSNINISQRLFSTINKKAEKEGESEPVEEDEAETALQSLRDAASSSNISLHTIICANIYETSIRYCRRAQEELRSASEEVYEGENAKGKLDATLAEFADVEAMINPMWMRYIKSAADEMLSSHDDTRQAFMRCSLNLRDEDTMTQVLWPFASAVLASISALKHIALPVSLNEISVRCVTHVASVVEKKLVSGGARQITAAGAFELEKEIWKLCDEIGSIVDSGAIGREAFGKALAMCRVVSCESAKEAKDALEEVQKEEINEKNVVSNEEGRALLRARGFE
uniref:Conserved oligomeric Golgi complex subunit 4 n=1 Tax=Palpitomonas bilix TaxID=652834 RepID=A0A7S3DAL3_9EUKA|mmetsp:Transcript_29458/g.76029  ORF Transcript_29458/g.76029 Transcript_29458/m.76029 type:complete len:737 (+) Transcript_29458:248-2458(+)|eukprot:CAMPEP_0113912814 /NCGR_PEP_ID=MMETSP0780_2-20120614/29157_1 /TAXON_ID=652834 /ORGANISM="Palpitomonas bilix" /LENGTH=736 /DNA_ID=CAMNT_0000909857 /DNA_START=1174 /DNA_END=3384 /DNA_ORIENTATION=- /assembly_acc=CAM_ASM_000599